MIGHINPRLFHISESPDIHVFEPRPAPAPELNIPYPVVFAISEKLLHNYLFPRDCPRVTYYRNEKSTRHDVDTFFGASTADYILAIESVWLERVESTVIYCYEFPIERFFLFDECAGYYLSKESIKPISCRQINNPLTELLSGNREIRIMPDLRPLASTIVKSTLNYSCIRMRNAGSSAI
jgi:hypothetical protein